METNYIVKGFYQRIHYVSEYKYYAMSQDKVLEVSLDRNHAEKLDLEKASDAAKILREKGFININIEEVK